ncbi:TolC family protein [Chitinophaga nivalis]|uniref:TolC family protein n=1 Tax=Chitinophaga nivalis TaxID=2991709 RepID=A0ABT3ITR6_9BACT|nr:TolC family protein [Chitinophaga nivalis]MCW3463000.1 TolC family protein [Chitinophaga nivalis]MCW3487310.1 TolC family protein [Chitinophaga nivalis]
MFGKKYLLIFLFLAGTHPMYVNAQQVLTLKDAIHTAVSNYGTIKAKSSYASASQTSVTQAKRDYLPNLNISAQQDYGTINGQNGPLYGFGGLGVASSGQPLQDQNWNAAFGALYLANVNWDFFAFGRAKEKIKTAQAVATRDNKDWQQEIFQHEVKVAAAYLNLLAAQKLTLSYQKNLNRADTFRNVVVTRVKNGLNAGVDSSQANAEVSSARIALTRAVDFEQTQANQLAQLMGIPPRPFTLDTLFVSHLPAFLSDTAALQQHPLLQWYQSRIDLSKEQSRYYQTMNYPIFSLVSILQTRGSGFEAGYSAQNLNAYTHQYWEGIKPTRTNYLIGIGVTWNLTQPLRISRQVKAQKLISKGLQDEYELAGQQLTAQLQLSETKIANALDNYKEVPVQVKAASDAYLQKSVLYKNGLTNLVDVTQALYALIRAETDRDIIYSNVWQALLLKASATGDFMLFEKEL